MDRVVVDQMIDNQQFEGRLDSEFEGCTFSGCDFTAADLTSSRFIDCVFNHCDLSNARVHKAAFQQLVFHSCKLLGLHFDECNHFGFEAVFDRCLLDHATFNQMDLKRCGFIGCRMHHVDLSEADLTAVDLSGSDLSGAVFDHSILHAACLEGAVHYRIDPRTNRIKGARFSMPEVVSLLDAYDIRIQGRD